nr:hypothetical protein [Streptococcus agalactiae]
MAYSCFSDDLYLWKKTNALEVIHSLGNVPKNNKTRKSDSLFGWEAKMINDKNRYRGSLLAQSILKEKVTRTVTKDEMLETVNLDYRRLIIIQLVSIAFGGMAIWCLIALVLLTVVGILICSLHNDLPFVTAIPIESPIKMIWLEGWQINVAIGLIGTFGIFLDKWATNKMDALREATDKKQLTKDYLAWKEEHNG